MAVVFCWFNYKIFSPTNNSMWWTFYFSSYNNHFNSKEFSWLFTILVKPYIPTPQTVFMPILPTLRTSDTPATLQKPSPRNRRVRWTGTVRLTPIHPMCKTESLREAGAQHKLSSVPFLRGVGWGWLEGGSRGSGHTCIFRVDSLWCIADTNTTL